MPAYACLCRFARNAQQAVYVVNKQTGYNIFHIVKIQINKKHESMIVVITILGGEEMCGIAGIINTDRKCVSGSYIRDAIRIQRDRGNGLGGGFAAYGIYPEHAECYAFHIMYEGDRSLPVVEDVEGLLRKRCAIVHEEEIPTYTTKVIFEGPFFKRYFILPNAGKTLPGETEEDKLIKLVMDIHKLKGAFVVSSGKNMGVFKGVGYPEDIADFFRIEDYFGWMWIAHNRFPTNTPGCWSGAHPFSILDKSVVHNGEITSYGTNRRWLSMYGYDCLLETDTEVISYIFDKLTRRDGLSVEQASLVMAPPLWDNIRRSRHGEALRLRQIYGAAMINGPFGIVLSYSSGALILNDRNKLRPVVCAQDGATFYASSEEASIRLLSPQPECIWSPSGGEPLIVTAKALGEVA